MKRRTQEEIEFTCSNRKCKKQVEEVWSFTIYGNEARKELADKPFCESCFVEMEREL